MSEVRLLGSGGWIPTKRRATCCALVRNDDRALVIDAGTGLAHLVEHPDLLEGVRELDIVLTHFHLDHVVGLAYLPALPTATPPRLHGPGAWLYDLPTEQVVADLVGPPFFPASIASMVSSVEEVSEAGLSLGSLAVRVRAQRRHPHPTLALRVGDELTYCTDTAFDPDNAGFASGSRVLAHEAWFTEDEPRDEGGHSSARQAGLTASAAGVAQLVLIHVRPGADEKRLLHEAHGAFAHAAVGEDLMRLGQA